MSPAKPPASTLSDIGSGTSKSWLTSENVTLFVAISSSTVALSSRSLVTQIVVSGGVIAAVVEDGPTGARTTIWPRLDEACVVPRDL